jgi:hypothetical protein
VRNKHMLLVVLTSLLLWLSDSSAAEPSLPVSKDYSRWIEQAMSPDASDTTRIDVLLYIAIEQQKDLDIANARVEMYQKLYATEKRPWYEAAWDSDITKAVLFVGGFWLGQRDGARSR